MNNRSFGAYLCWGLVFSFMTSGEIHAEQFAPYDYTIELRTLREEKNERTLRLTISLLKNKILFEEVLRKQAGYPNRNSQLPIIREALLRHGKSQNEEVRVITGILLREIAAMDAEKLKSECKEAAKADFANRNNADLNAQIEFYAEYCMEPNSKTSLAFFNNAVRISSIPYYLKVDMAVALKSEQDEVVNYLIAAARKYVDENNRSGTFRIALELCKNRGITMAQRISPMLKEAYYHEFAEVCFSNLKPEVWPFAVALIESGSYPQVRQGLRLLSRLATKDSVPALEKRIRETQDQSEVKNLRFLIVKILRQADSQLEETLIRASAVSSKEGAYEHLSDSDIAEYYAYTRNAEKVDSYLFPLLTKRRRNLYWQICRVYEILETPTDAATKLLKILKNEEKENFPSSCINVLSKESKK